MIVVWHKRDRYGRIVGHVLLDMSGDCGRPDCPRLADAGLAQIESYIPHIAGAIRHEFAPL